MARPGGQRLTWGTGSARAYLAFFKQHLTWLPIITEQTPGATPLPDFDTDRMLPARGDLSEGVGFQLLATGRIGFDAPVHNIAAAVLDQASASLWKEAGQFNYEQPILFADPTYRMQRFDVIVVESDGRRFVIGDTLKPWQVSNNIILDKYALEGRAPDDAIYSLPTT